MASLRNLAITILRLAGNYQHRRRPALPCQTTRPAIAGNHEGLTGFAEPCRWGPSAAHFGWMPVAMPAARRAAAVTGLSLAPHATSQ